MEIQLHWVFRWPPQLQPLVLYFALGSHFCVDFVAGRREDVGEE
jgi:hypothetical protein